MLNNLVLKPLQSPDIYMRNSLLTGVLYVNYFYHDSVSRSLTLVP